MNTLKPRVVFDCMIYLQAVVRDTSLAANCLRLAEMHQIELFISRKIIAEVQEVLGRDKIRERFKTITNARVTEFLQRIQRTANRIHPVPQHFDYHERDAKDEPYLNLAIEVRADYLVSRDNDLLDLMSWNREAGREFQKRYRFLKIVTPETFLAEINTADETQ